MYTPILCLLLATLWLIRDERLLSFLFAVGLLGSGYVLLCRIVDKHVVTMKGNALVVQTIPLPTFANRVIPCKHLLAVEPVAGPGKSFDLVATMKDGTRVKILKAISRDQAELVEAMVRIHKDGVQA
jgi:hypothetical protein